MKDGDEISFETSLEKTVVLRADNARQTTRVDQEYWIKIAFPDGKYLRRDLGVGTYVLQGIYDDVSELEGARANRKIAGMSYPEAVEKGREVMESIPAGVHPGIALKGWIAFDPHETKSKRLPGGRKPRPTDN